MNESSNKIRNYGNNIIYSFCIDGHITNKQYELLFKDKKDYLLYNQRDEKIIDFYTLLTDVLRLFEKNKIDKIDLSYISFIHFNNSLPSYYHNLLRFHASYSFSHSTFYGNSSFMNTTFPKKVYFDNSIFYGEADFSYCTFDFGISLIKSTFHENTFFNNCKFKGEAYFKHANFKQIVDFSNSKFKTFELTNCNFNVANFNKISDFNSLINKKVFENKETARIIKSHFEKQNNITEAK